MIRRYKLILSLFNAIIVLLLFFIIQKSHILPGNTSKLFYLGPVIKNILFPKKKQVNTNSYIVINTSYDRMLVDYYRTIKGRSYPRGNVAITDRAKLLKLFNLLNTTNSYKYIICNLAFDQASPIDSALGKTMLKTNRMIVAKGYFQQQVVPEFKNLNYGLATIYMPSGNLSKYRMLETTGDSLIKSVPLKMYEELDQTAIKYGSFFSKLKNKYIFNDFVVEQFVDHKKSIRDDLGRIITRDSIQFDILTKDRVILIGDFYNNTRKTLYDSKTPSLIILLNAYFSINNGSNEFSLSLLGFLLVIFIFFSYLVFSKQSKQRSKIFKIPMLGALLGGARYILAFALIGIFIYFVFGNNLNLVYIGLFFYIENIIFNYKFHLNRLKRLMNLEKKS
jgi:hypothetical protein